jgi:hypothetical protein
MDDRNMSEIYCNRAHALSSKIKDTVGLGRALMHFSELEQAKGNY